MVRVVRERPLEQLAADPPALGLGEHEELGQLPVVGSADASGVAHQSAIQVCPPRPVRRGPQVLVQRSPGRPLRVIGRIEGPTIAVALAPDEVIQTRPEDAEEQAVLIVGERPEADRVGLERAAMRVGPGAVRRVGMFGAVRVVGRARVVGGVWVVGRARALTWSASVDGGQQLVHARADRGRGQEHLGTPGSWPVAHRTVVLGTHREHRPQRCGRPVRAREVRLGHDDQVGHLHEPGLERLDLVAHARCLDHDRRIDQLRDRDLALTRPHGLHEHEVEAGPGQHRGRIPGRRREPTRLTPAGHAPDEHTRILGVLLHPDPVPEDGAPGDGTGRIDREHRDASARRPDGAHERTGETALAGTRRAREAHEMRPRATRRESPEHVPAAGAPGLDLGQQPAEGASIARPGRAQQLQRGPQVAHPARGRTLARR